MTIWAPINGASFLGLDDQARKAAVEMAGCIDRKRFRNELRRRYYEGHNALRDLGIAIPPPLRTLEVVVGWPAKAVDAMSRRTVLESFTTEFAGSEVKSLVDMIWQDNRMSSEVPSAHTSALTHSCAFGFVTKGDTSIGQPDVVLSLKPAEDATGIWDQVRRTLSAALSVDDRNRESGEPTLMHLYLPNRVIRLDRNDRGVFEASATYLHAAGVPVEVLPYRASLNRPFGRSRVSRAVMYLTDAAVRTMLRTEVAAEFYNAPQRYVLGADDTAFEDENGNPIPGWKAVIGRLLTLTKDEDGDLPTVGTFAQQTMQPNVDQLRSIAQMFAAETSLPVASLGIVQDNPSSAEAMQVANEELGVEIEHWQRTALSPAHERLMRRAIDMATGSSAAAQAEARTLRAHWGKWWVPNEAAEAQAALARVQAIPDLALTDVELERMGYSLDEITRIHAQIARAKSLNTLTNLSALAQQQQPQVAPSGIGG